MPRLSLPRFLRSLVPGLSVSTLAILSVAACFIAAAAQFAFAQGSVQPICPQGYVLSGNNCIKTAPSPACPQGYSFAGGKCIADRPQPASGGGTGTVGPWAFITREAFGVNSARELDGANYCAVAGSPAAEAASAFFKDNGMSATLVEADSDRAGMEEYQKNGCDILVVEKRAASSTARTLQPAGAHIVLPETIGEAVASPDSPASPAPTASPAAPQPDLAYSLQAELKRIGCLEGAADGVWGNGSRAALQRFSQALGRPLGSEPSQEALNEARALGPGYCPPQAPQQPQAVKRKRCSGITYAYTRGNTCACSGGRVFTGSRCVFPR